MRMDDMILVSIDDHSIEPPDMYKNHVPAKWADQVPKVVRNDQGVDEWVFQGQSTSTPFGMAATVGWPREEWGFNPGSFAELRPGCFDVHERVRDMNANGVLASMCFPTMAGFNARTFVEAGDKELSLVMLQAYNDWHIDEWCAAYPGRFIPLGIVPIWDVELAAQEVRRIAKKGCRAISFLEAPHSQGWPSFLSGYWDPMLQALVDENMVLCLHIGAAWDIIKLAPEAPVDHMIVIPSQVTMLTAQDLLFGPTLRKFPGLARRTVGGRHRLDPLLPGPRRPSLPEPVVDRQQLRRGQAPVGRVPRALPRLLHHRPVRPEASGRDRARRHRVGVRLPAHRHDVAGVAGVRLEGVPAGRPVATTRSTRSRGRTRAGSSTGTRSRTSRRTSATVGALRALATDVETTRMPREEWRRRNEAAGFGAL